MRKISYTQMRAELSDILDAIRNGESVIVTQRGRPDTILEGFVASENKPHENVINASYILSDGQKRILRSGTLKISFTEALVKTKEKHAKILKALEDK